MSELLHSLNYVDFEKPIVDLHNKIEELKGISSTGEVSFDSEIGHLEGELKILRDEIFNSLTPIQVCQLARHPMRPYTLDYIQHLFTDFTELHGDRKFADDPAIVGGMAYFNQQSVMIIGHQKGRGTKEGLHRNFGMPRPEGYRKGIRLMKMADQFNLPIITFIDTPGAYPGVGAEERGQAEAIAESLYVMSQLKVPIITFIIGEGGSGGALALAVPNELHMLEYSTFSVISPEGCASILWKDKDQAATAAESLKLTAEDLLGLDVIDSILKEPVGGAHQDAKQMADTISQSITSFLKHYQGLEKEEILERRLKKLRNLGLVHLDDKSRK